MKRKSSPLKILFSIDLKENGGSTSFYSLTDFVEWARHERKLWDWITACSDPRVPNQIGFYLADRLDSIVNYAKALAEAGSIEGHYPENALDGHYGGDHPALYHSRSSTGQTILLIKETFGETEAAIAYALLVGIESFSPRNPLHFKLMGLVANPATVEVVRHIEVARGILGEAAAVSEEIHSRQRLLLSEAKSKTQTRDKQARQLIRTTIRKLVWSNWQIRQKLMKSGHEITQKMEQTRLAYEQAMQLRAAVSYWEDKRKNHNSQKDKAFEQLKVFCWIAGVSGVLVFTLVSVLILEGSRVDVTDWIELATKEAQPAPTFFAAMFAFLGTMLTCLFWAGRVLVRNYLTERRMVADAEERRIMTKTFLALINEGAVKEDDRLVVLNALFRPAADTTGGDENSLDIALPAIVAKLMDQRSLR